MEEYKQSNIYFLQMIVKYKKQFGIITLIAIIASVLFSSEFFIKPKYKSFAIVYPSNIIPYSSESQSEQLLQLLQSSDIRNSIIKNFHLNDHYDIDTLEKGGMSKLISAYESNVEVSRTQFESIEIRVLDTDSKLACAIVNEIINSLNLKARNLQREKTKELEVIVKNDLLNKRKQIDSLNSILMELRTKYQILDYNSQVREVTKGYVKALGSGKSGNNFSEVNSLMKNLESKGGEYYEIKETFDAILKSYNKTKLEYDIVLKDLNKKLTYTNIVTRPFEADKKSTPVRWLIVLTSVASVNLLLFVSLLVLDTRKK